MEKIKMQLNSVNEVNLVGRLVDEPKMFNVENDDKTSSAHVKLITHKMGKKGSVTNVYVNVTYWGKDVSLLGDKKIVEGSLVRIRGYVSNSDTKKMDPKSGKPIYTQNVIGESIEHYSDNTGNEPMPDTELVSS